MRSNRLIGRFILGLFLFLGFSLKGMAQKKIEKLESDDDVVKFVKIYFANKENPDPTWKNFQLVDGNEWQGLYNLSQKMSDSLTALKVVKWQVIDFNFDKKQDLIVSGKIPHGSNNEFVLLAFLSNEDGDYDVKSLVPSEYQTFPYYFSLMSLPKINVPGIRIVKWFPDINNESPNGYPFTVDTLGFAQEYLVNFNPRPDSALFKTVKFESLNYDGKRTIVTIDHLDRGNSSPFTIIYYGNKPNDSTVINGKITMELYAQLLSTINYSGFKELPNQYQSNSNWPQTYILDVTYADGTTKRVHDYSGGGTYTLSAIYSWYDWLIDYSNQSLQQRRVERDRERSPF